MATSTAAGQPWFDARLAQTMADALLVPIAVLDHEGTLLDANDAWFAAGPDPAAVLTNFKPGVHLPSALTRAGHEADWAEAAGALRELLEGRRQRFEFEYCRDGDQGMRWFIARFSRFVHDTTAGVIVSHDEITRQRRTERALQASEERFRRWAETSSDMICRHAADGTFKYVSPASRTLLGYAPAELLDRSPYDYFHPDDMARIRASHESVLSGQRTDTITYRLRRRDGTYVWVESTSLAIRDDQGRPVEIHTATRDVSDRRRREEQLRRVQTAIDQVQDAVVITTAELELPGPQIVYVNPAFTRMTGYEASEVIGLTPRILQGPATDRALLDRLKQVLGRGEVFTGQTVNYRKDRTPFTIQWQVAPVRDEQDRVVNYVSIQRDITEEIQRQERSRQREAQLAHAARLNTMGELASGLAHELNQPLSALVNYTQGCLRRMQRGDWKPQPLIDAMKQAADQAERAARIIRRLRQFMRKRGPQFAPTRLHDLVEDSVALMSHDLQQDQVQLRVECPPDLPEVHCDAIQIEQVILNLMRNAVEAMKSVAQGQRRLTVRLRRAGDAAVELEVADTGPGVADGQRQRLFEPFFTTKAEGMGLGLSISQSIIESHGGRLRASTGRGGGMAFVLTLPLCPSPASDGSIGASESGIAGN